jgi:hypothetical protein
MKVQQIIIFRVIHSSCVKKIFLCNVFLLNWLQPIIVILQEMSCRQELPHNLRNHLKVRISKNSSKIFKINKQ